MFDWLFRKRRSEGHEETKQAFNSVKSDMESVGKWIKHLDTQDKQLFDNLQQLKDDIATIKDELGSLREALEEISDSSENKQVFEKTPVYDKQTAVLDVEEAVQMPVQTGNILDILQNLSESERLLIGVLLNSQDMKLSYEDIALMLGKEKSTIRGQINTIKQKTDGLLEEITEKSGKKRVYIPLEMREKLVKYGKVRVTRRKKAEK